VLGSILSVIGTLVNNLEHNHILAMRIWAWSNPMLAVWAIGYLAGIWNGGVSVGALLGMYAIFTVTNWWGLRKYKQDPLLEE
jgi:ABC-type xylose transport system permease subunit